MRRDKVKKRPTSGHEDQFPDYPLYPSSEDIYSQFKEEDSDLDLNVKERLEITGKNDKQDFQEDLTGEDLDIPGSELDDAQEEIGSEDEENNYYSLGGDDHENLEEEKGD